MNWLRVILLIILLIKLIHGKNPFLPPIATDDDDDDEGNWRTNLMLHIIHLLDEHRIVNQNQNNDLAFLQFESDRDGFSDQFFIKFYQRFNDRAVVITQQPLDKEFAIFRKSSFVVMFLCKYDKKKLQTFLKEIQLSVFWHSVKPILVVPTFPITLKSLNWLSHLFSYFKYEYLFNIGVVYYSQRFNRIERIGYNPFATDPLIVEPKNLFANKVKNLNGYELKITQYDDPPRSVISGDGIINGMDGLALHMVCKYLNATARVMKVAGGPETSYSNVIYDLVTRRADLNFNRRIFWSKNYLNSIAIPIYPYEHEDIVLMIPAAQVVMPYRHFIDAFKKELWITIGIIFVAIIGVWYVVNQRLVNISLDLVRMHLALPLPRVITDPRERRLFWLISMYTFIVFQTYQTKLTSFLMSRRYLPNYQTIAEVNDSNLELVFSRNYQALINNFLAANSMKNKRFDTNLSVWQLREALLNNDTYYHTKMAFFITKRESELFTASTYNKVNDEFLLEPIPENILTSAASYLALKNSPFETEISNVIRRMRESGLNDHFNVIGFFDVCQHLNLTTQFLIKTNTKPKRVQLSVRVITPVLHVYGLGLFISFGCFLFECSFHSMLITAKRIKRYILNLQIRAILRRWAARFVLYLERLNFLY